LTWHELRLIFCPVTHDILRLLVSSDPRGVAERLLEHVIVVLRASGGAVFALRKGGLSAFVERTALQGIAQAMATWDLNLSVLIAGGKAADGNTCILPLLSNGILIGGVWLDGVDPRLCELGETAAPLVAALEAPPLPTRGIEEFLDTTDQETLLREQTLRFLRQAEWNVAAVARRMKVTRRTIYLRLDRWGIDREKVVKGRRRLRTSEAS
jgi:hypothetical protein